MTADVLAWVARREPPAPLALADRVAAALGSAGGDGGEPASGASPADVPPDDVAGGEAAAVVTACLRAAEATLTRVLDDGGTVRAAALDLLAADALATYAFEAASEAPNAIPVTARAAMARLSRVAMTTRDAAGDGTA